MRNNIKKWLSAFIAVTLLAGMTALPVTAYAEENNVAATVIDVSDIGKGTVVEHTHIYQTYYDDYYHWDQCIVCGETKNKEAHTLEGNGGSKVLFSDYYSDAYHESCECGYESDPQIVILGTHENYPNGKDSRITYSPLKGTKLGDIKEITKSEYDSLKASYQALSGASYEWYDYDGDGYGYVFASSLVIGNEEYGAKGTIELIIGSEGDCGRKAVYDEYYTLVAYCRSDSTPTRTEFADYIAKKISASTNPTDHALYGYDSKYRNRVTDAQFNRLAEIAKYIDYHAPSWGCGSMVLTYDSVYTAPGYHYYGNYMCGCYDSNIGKEVGWGTGYAGTCDVCGKTYTGNETYTNTGWVNDSAGNKECVRNVNGGTYDCEGHEVYGPGKVYLGKTYCHFKNENGKVYVRFTLEPADGYTASQTNSGWIECSKADTSNIVHYVNGVSTATFYKNGTAVRSMYLGYYYVLNDNTAPSAYGYSNITTDNDYWKVTGNGSKDNISTNARITVTFKDPDQYSYNTLKVRMYDSDGTTLLKQTNGDIYTPLSRISGTAGTSGGQGIWKGTCDICAEVNGTKLIFVQAVDATGNVSEKIPVQIQYLDSKGPEIKVLSSENLDSWSAKKTITLSASDVSGTVYLGTCNEDLKLISDSTYENMRTYEITGNSSETKSITFYAKDSVGNVSFETVEFNSLDGTAPVITSAEVSDVFEGGEAVAWKITAAGTDEASGISGYAITTSEVSPAESDYQADNEFSIPSSGSFYIWVKDTAGNVTRSDKVIVHSDLIYNGREIHASDYNGFNPKCIYYNGKRIRL